MSGCKSNFGSAGAGSGNRAALWPLLGLAVAALAAGCGLRLLEHRDGRPVLSREAAAPSELLWRRLVQRAGALDLVLTGIRPERREIQFDWITAPGDGRLYLDCTPTGPIGSASLRPRVVVRAVPPGSVIVVSTEVRATTAGTCRSTGQFEEWLLDRLEPAIAAAVTDASAAAGPPQ